VPHYIDVDVDMYCVISQSFQDDDDFEFVRQMQGANLSSTYIEDHRHRKLPSVVKWEGGGQSVYVSFDDGATKIPMVKRYKQSALGCHFSCSC